MVTTVTGLGDNVINAHVIRRQSDQVTSFPDWSTVENCTFAEAYQAALDAELPTVNVGDLKDGSVNKIAFNPLAPVEAPDAFVKAGDPVVPWNKNLRVVIGTEYSHNGDLWICRQTHDAQQNWSPGSNGTDALWTKVSFSVVWDFPVAYVIGDQRYYPTINDTLYECIQAHQSIETWNPPAVPALWVVV